MATAPTWPRRAVRRQDDRVLPDLDDLLADPHAYLSEAPLAFGPRRMYRLAGLFAALEAAVRLARISCTACRNIGAPA